MKTEITEVKFRKLFDTEPLKAVCSITINDSVAVHDIKLVNAGGRLMLVMPSKRRSSGEFADIVHPINSQVRKNFEDAVVNEYEKFLTNIKFSAEI